MKKNIIRLSNLYKITVFKLFLIYFLKFEISQKQNRYHFNFTTIILKSNYDSLKFYKLSLLESASLSLITPVRFNF